ncbi:MAG TPA: shikimate dehydrogenase, partial [Blastocatellia bacterium]|nr:shikimate dehydrogenase [Blastocatellia bacterium]
ATRRLDWRLRGLSVTIPHKVAIIPHLDLVDATARTIGAVNTVVIEGDRLEGYNTDVIGAMRPLDDMIEVRNARVAVLGAGGSARAICYGLRERGAQVTIYGRERGKAQLLAEQFGARAAAIDDFAGEAEVVVNCTPVGMRGHSEGNCPIDPELLREVELVYDLIYNPEETRLLTAARAQGCRTLGGLNMLAGQAAEQFRLWTGLEPPSGLMRNALDRGHF